MEHSVLNILKVRYERTVFASFFSSSIKKEANTILGHDWATSLSLFTFTHWRRKWQPTPVFLPGESQGRGAWWAAVYGVAQSRTRLKWLSSSRLSPLCHIQCSLISIIYLIISMLMYLFIPNNVKISLKVFFCFKT